MIRRPSGWAIAAVVLVLFGAGLATFAIVRAVTDDDCPASADGTSLEDALVLTESATAPFEGLTAADVAIGGECRRLVIADTSPERADGLRGRTDVDPYDGMLFVFDAESLAAFTMAGVTEPLDIAFYNARGSEVGRQRMVPCEGEIGECPSYRSPTPYRFALETPAGDLLEGSLTGCHS